MAMKFVRVTVGDKQVCPDCIQLESLPEATMEQWDNSGQAPRVANTQCGARCRCGLVPSTLEDIETYGKQRIDKIVKDIKENIITDITHGGRILLKDFDKIKDITKISYKIIADMESLITDWKIQNNFTPLPKEFFKIADIPKMITWLKKEIK